MVMERNSQCCMYSGLAAVGAGVSYMLIWDFSLLTVITIWEEFERIQL